MSGGFLMPKTRVWRLAQTGRHERWKLPISADSPQRIYLAEYVIIAFHVSSLAVRVRLKQLWLLA